MLKIAAHCFVALLMVSQQAAAAEGIKVRFKVAKEIPAESGQVRTSSYENAFLFGFNESVVADFKNITRIQFFAEDKGQQALLCVSLYDHVDGVDTLVGEGQVSARFGEYSQIQWPTRAPLP